MIAVLKTCSFLFGAFQYFKLIQSRDVCRILSNIYDGAFLQKIIYSCQLLTVKSLTGFLNSPLQSLSGGYLNNYPFPNYSPLDIGCKLNVHKTFSRRPRRLLKVLCTFNLRPVSRDILQKIKEKKSKKRKFKKKIQQKNALTK